MSTQKFADLVLEGPGLVSAIALTGAVTALGEDGYDFQRVAGSSGGALPAAFLASGMSPDRLKETLSTVDFTKFMDRRHRVSVGRGTDRAYYDGAYLHEWVKAVLESMGVATFADLRLDDPGNSLSPGHGYKLVLLVTDVERRSLLRLPWDCPALGLDPDRMQVADAVRAAVTIPLLFTPVSVRDAGGGRHRLVDGMVQSDFRAALELFDRLDEAPPRWPTIGARVVVPPNWSPEQSGVPDSLRATEQAMLTVPDLSDPLANARTIMIQPSAWPGATALDLSAEARNTMWMDGLAAAHDWLRHPDVPASPRQRKGRPEPEAARQEASGGDGAPHPAPEGAAQVKATTGPEVTEAARLPDDDGTVQGVPLSGFSFAVAGYDADAAPAVGQKFRDFVGIKPYVDAFAYLIAARDLTPPLAIGLFGDWGSGKTFFMRALQARLNYITREAHDSGKRQAELGIYMRVAQIEFNAWHYVEGNLWASLVEHVFDNLRTSDKEPEDELRDRRDRIAAELQSTKQEQARAKEQIDDLQQQISKCEIELERLREQHRQKEAELQSAKLGPSLRNVTLSKEDLALVTDGLQRAGLEPIAEQVPELIQAVQQARSVLERGNALTAPLLAKRRRWTWMLVLFAAILIAPLVSFLLARLDLPGLTRIAATIATFLSAVTVVVSRGMSWLASSLTKLEQADRELRAKVAEATSKQIQQIAALEVELAELHLDQQRERETKQTAEQRIEEIGRRLSDLTPGRILADFISERGAAEDYRKYLGVTALIRQDFEQLSRLIQRQNAALFRPDAADPNVDFNRIVLYIDDLDRCPPQRVVEVLQAVHLLLSFPLFVVVVAVDARWLAQSLETHYQRLLSTRPQQSWNNDQIMAITPQDYLEKIFQIPFWMKPLEPDARARMIAGLLAKSGSADRPASTGPDGDEVTAGDNQAPVGNGSHPDPTRAQARAGLLDALDRLSDDEEELAGPVDFNPSSMKIDSDERDSIAELLPLLGHSPRSLTRFVNIYRLVKSIALADAETAAEAAQPERRVALLPLAIVTGMPSISRAFFDAIEKRAKEHDGQPPQNSADEPLPPVTLAEIVADLSASSDGGGRRELERLRDWLSRSPGWGETDLNSLIFWATRIYRYSFLMMPEAAVSP
jgi:predicted acylesterase/phospholipase RssA